jgi:hypothetical protein
MVKRLAAATSGFDGNREILFEFRLPDELSERFWAQRKVELAVFVFQFGRDDTLIRHRYSA